MKQRLVWALVGVAVLVVGCVSGGSGGSLVVGEPPGEQSVGVFAVAAADDVPVGEMVAAERSGESDGQLQLVSAGIDSLTVRWVEGFAPGAAGFRLRWRVRPFRGDEETVWWSTDLEAGVRTYTIGDLQAGTRYRLRLNALDASGNQGALAKASFQTLSPPTRNLTATVLAHDAARFAWDGPDGWAPVGYVLQWRERGAGEFLGRLEMPAGRRSQTVTGLGGGTEYVFRLTARTATGFQSRPATLGVTTPAAPEGTLRLEVSAAHHCIAQEGLSAGYGWGGPVEDEYWVREGVPSVPVQWRVSGGEAPYVVLVGGVETRGTSGTVDVTCAKAGIDLNNLKDPDLKVIESGPKTITLEATDTTGATTTRTHTIEIIQHAGSAGNFYKGETFTPGHTYYSWGRFFETPEGENIAFRGLIDVSFVDGGGTEMVSFRRVVDGGRDTVAWQDMFTGERRGHWPVDETKGPDGQTDYTSLITLEDIAVWDTFFDSMRYTPFPAGDARNEPPVPLATSASGALRQATAPVCIGRGGDVVEPTPARLWRPYGRLPSGQQGLHCSEMVVVHPRLLNGEPITVCVEGETFDGLFNLPAGHLTGALAAAVGDWNVLLSGLGRDALDYHSTTPACPAGLADEDVSFIRVFDRRDCQVMRTCPHDTAGWVVVTHQPEPLPRVEWNILEVFRSVGGDAAAKRVALERVFRHELGHFLGLADYGYGCWRLLGDAGVVQASLMSYGQLRDDPHRTATKLPVKTSSSLRHNSPFL